MPNLADLIQARRAERGWSYRTLSARADHVVSAQRWQQLGTDVRIKEFPEPATIRAMADALEVDVTSVVLATAASIGLPVTRRQSELAAMLPGNADDLTAEQRDAVLAVIRAMAPPALHDAGKVSSALQSPAGGRGDTRRRRKRNVPQPRHPVKHPEPTADDGSKPVYEPAEELAAWRMSLEEMEIVKRSRPGDEDYPAGPPNDDDEGR
ncbi:hypothetical protein [Nocardia puris]|uniref:hypothetical protein n=1 Tax=Nocardia puris TaxID=208602 RepID=UPI002E1C15ED